MSVNGGVPRVLFTERWGRRVLVVLALPLLVLSANGMAARDVNAGRPGGEIAFAVRDYIAIIAPNGSHERDLATPDECCAAWSPDASKLAFDVFLHRHRNQTDIWVMSANGRNRQRLLRNAGEPAWSSNGRTLAFDRGNDLWVMNADGTGAHRLTQNGFSPDWSPDGTKLVYVSGTNSYLFTVNADGRSVRRIYPPPRSGVCDCAGPPGRADSRDER